jgi:flagellar biosynthetic protein FliR
MVFTTDLHHLLFAAMRDSYLMFKPGQMLPVGDFAQMMVGIVGGAFKVGLQLAAPFVVFGLIFNLGQGVLSRLMPQVQIFFVSMPANIYLGFVLLMLLLTPIMMWYLDHFSMGIKEFIR